MRLRQGRIALVLAAAALGGCASLPSSPPTLAPRDVEAALEQATQFALDPMRNPPSSQLVNLEAGYAGGFGSRSLVVLVFEHPAATRQVLGDRRSSLPIGVVDRRQNVVVISRGDGAFQRIIDRALERVPSTSR